MFEFSCFLHPQQKGESLDELCPVCKEPFGFPLEKYPNVINGKSVERAISRGFYGAVFLTKHPRTNAPYATKLIPVATYAPRTGGGYEKDFLEEARLHLELSGTGLVAELQDHSSPSDVFVFGEHTIACHWLEMNFVKGPTLEERIANAPEDPREVAQIAWDLLDFVQALQDRGRFHNDLHARNIKITSLLPSEARRNAIHSRIRIKVLDLGSAADRTKSDAERFGDVHWVAQHILNLLSAFERSHSLADPATVRLCSQLRRVAEFYCGRDILRPPTPEEMKSAVHAAYSYGERPWNQPVRLTSVAEHYNAQTLPSWFAPELLHDPGGQWARRLMGPGPQLLTGMRGCGKTVLLRSLEWVARAQRGSRETAADVRKRVTKDTFLGLFVSCAALLRTPRSEALDLPLHRLFVAFAREVIRDLQACELMGLGVIDYNSLGDFSKLVSRVCGWYEPPSYSADLVGLERSLSNALHNPPAGERGIPDVNPRLAFDELAASARRLVDIWANKKLLFLLDDVSTRYLTPENVQSLLSQLCLQSPEFGFKVSTETQTLRLFTPGGEAARVGRDYEVFDLGADVIARLRGVRGTEFIGEVLFKRVSVTDAIRNVHPEYLLGRQSLVDIAKVIRLRWRQRSEPKKVKPGKRKQQKTAVYWGLDALAGLCVGDIGDVLQLYAGIVAQAAHFDPMISKETQDEVMTDFAERKLFSLAGQEEWLYSHAVAFAEASHRELKNSGKPRLRQYNEIFVKIDPADADLLFPKIVKLIDAGVFLFTGGTPRTKSHGTAPFLQFKLAYRKALGLTNRIPLSMRDRFELSGRRLAEWLEHPSSAKLRPKGRSAKPAALVVNDSPRSQEGAPERALSALLTQPSLFVTQPQDFGPEPGDRYPMPHVLHVVETAQQGDLREVPINWGDKHVIAGFGFETRSLGAWRNLLPVGRPGALTMLEYPDAGLAAEIMELLSTESIPFSTASADGVPALETADALIDHCGHRAVVVDTTSLTKALIYALVRQALLRRSQVWVLHTAAQSYHPGDSQLAPVVKLFESGRFPEAFVLLDKLVTGEVGPYRCVPIGAQHRDPSQPSLPATFVALKKERVTQLLEDVPVETIAAIAPIHSSGAAARESIVAKFIAQFLVQRYGGSIHEVGSLDHQKAYDLLVDLHRQYALDGGYNFEITLTGSKMHAVAAGMFAAIATPSSVYYSQPNRFNPRRFSRGTATTRLVHLIRKEARASPG
jgi:serine/threonine protein kinase